MGKPFAAGIRLNDEFRIEFDFGQGTASSKDETPDFTSQERLGTCPKCGARVFEHGAAYVCENAAGATRSCDFRSGKVILQQPVERLQMVKLLATGKTDLLPRFISKKGRPFKAYLVKGPHGRVSFEFEPRKGKATAAQKPTVPGTAVKLLREPAGKAVKKAAKPAAKPATRKRKQA